jgi:hypothetical protein
MSRNGSGVYSLPAGSTVANGDTSDATDLNTPLADIEADLNVARPVVAGGTGASSASGARTALGLAIGTDVQAYDAGLASIAGLTTAADRMIYTTASDVYAVATLTAAGRAILDDADAAAQLTTLGAQPLDTDLTALAALASTGLVARTGSGTYAERTITSTDSSVTITNPGGVAGNIDLSVAGGWDWQASVATTSGDDIVIGSSIPSTVTEMILLIKDVSFSGTDDFRIQLGTSGSYIATGYTGSTVSVSDTQFITLSLTTGFGMTLSSAGGVLSGVVHFWKVSGDIWECSINGRNTSVGIMIGSGNVDLGAALTRIRVNTTTTNTFDAGSCRVGWR